MRRPEDSHEDVETTSDLRTPGKASLESHQLLRPSEEGGRRGDTLEKGGRRGDPSEEGGRRPFRRRNYRPSVQPELLK